MANRRKFLQWSGAATASLLAKPLFAAPLGDLAEKQPGFATEFFATNWGFNGSMDEFCKKANQAGFEGVELWWPDSTEAQAEMFSALQKYQLKLGVLTGASAIAFETHQADFQALLQQIIKQSTVQPVYINLHSGRDYFTLAQNSQLIEYSLEISKQSGIPVFHETHRGRMMYTLPNTLSYLKQFPKLQLTLDISHWCCVHESMLEDQPESVNEALLSTGHIHARIGYQEGPQVSDPRAPEWEYALKAHLEWWDQVVAHKKRLQEPIRFLSEFGPPLYMQTLPYTLQPLANQWEINVFMMNLLRKRYTG